MNADEVARLQSLYQSYRSAPRGQYFENRQLAINSRLTYWPGQTPDGRKHYSNVPGQGPFPWEGATDLRLPLIDRVLREETAILVNALNPVFLRALPVQARDSRLAGLLTAFARWLLFSDQALFWREAGYLAELLLEDGVAVAMVYWDRRTRRQMQPVTVISVEEGLNALQAVVEMDLPVEVIRQVGLAEWFNQTLRDPAQEETVIRILKVLYPQSDATPGEWRKVVRDLAETNAAEIPVPVPVKDQPAFRALAFCRDIFLPPGCEDIDTADVVFLRELYTPSQLRVAARVRGYRAAWVEEVIKRDYGQFVQETDSRDPAEMNVNLLRTADEHVPAIEVVTAIERREREGVPQTRITVFSPAMEEMVGLSETYDDPDSVPAFVLWTYEARTRQPENSRGLPAVLWSLQAQIKRMRDLQCDRADLSIMPPWYHPPGARPPAFGPGVAVETAQPEMYGFFKGPSYDVGSDRLVSELLEEFRALAGRLRPDNTNAAEVMAWRQMMVNRWLVGWRKVVEIMVRLARKYAPERIVGRVIGTNQGEPITIGRDEMQVEFDVIFSWDPSQHDLEYKQTRLQMLKLLMEYDLLGRVDRSELTQLAAEIIDPSVAERLLRPAEAASLQEIDEEKAVLGRMLVGIGEDVRPGQNYALRLNALQQLLQTPTVQAQLGRNPDAAALVQNRLRQLQHQVQQQQNAIIGRLGAEPVDVGA